jgi:hypothetical protein
MIGRREGFSLGSSGLLSWKFQNFWRNMRRKSYQDKGRSSRIADVLPKILQMQKTLWLQLTIAVSYLFSINSFKNSLKSF